MQAVNRYTCDETRNQTGVKVGDFGTGGRTYVNTKRVSRDGQQGGDIKYGGGGKIGFCVIFCVCIGVVLGGEWSLVRTKKVLSEVKSTALELDAPPPGGAPASPFKTFWDYFSLEAWWTWFFPPEYRAKDELNNKLVHTFGKVSLQVDSGLKDPLFGRDFGDFVEFSRVPEYCQVRRGRRAPFFLTFFFLSLRHSDVSTLGSNALILSCG